MPWEAKNLPATVQAWYPGQAGGAAVADVLFGNTNPAGRLPVTFYSSTGDLPGFEDYSMSNRTYRYFTGRTLFPLWPRAELHKLHVWSDRSCERQEFRRHSVQPSDQQQWLSRWRRSRANLRAASQAKGIARQSEAWPVLGAFTSRKGNGVSSKSKFRKNVSVVGMRDTRATLLSLADTRSKPAPRRRTFAPERP